MKQDRPVFLDLTKIRFPLPAIGSILHRISGFIVFLLLPFLLWMAQMAKTPSGFDKLQDCFGSFIMKFFVWVFLAGLLYHLFAGIRHLLVDAHWLGEDLPTARLAAVWVIVLAVIAVILSGVWLW